MWEVAAAVVCSLELASSSDWSSVPSVSWKVVLFANGGGASAEVLAAE